MTGDILAHYRIKDRLGAGGMAVVWKATDLHLEREVALKLLPPEVSTDPDRVTRFLREARCASALNHPNIVTIYEANTAADTPYIAMEYVRGVTLAERLRGEPLGVERSVTIARQICSALAHAHDAGIVHRDLKPGNVMLTPEGTVKVLDFGIAKRAAVASAGVDETITAITAAGTTIGTVAYMSPEQALGDDVDTRSDIFSLGIVLYEMLTRTRPFAARTTVTEVRNLVYFDPRPMREIAPEVPETLEKVVERCLAKDRHDRYQSATEVAEALGSALAPSTDTASTVTAPLLAPNPSRWSFGLSGWVVAIMALATVVALVGASRYLPLVIGNGDRATRETAVYNSEYEASRAARAYLDRYDKKNNIDRAIEALEAALRINPEYAPALAGMSEAYLRRHIVTPDNQWLKAAADSARKAVSLNPDLAVSHTALGNVLTEQGDRKGAVASFTKATELDPSHGRAYLGLAKSAAAAGGTTEAEPLFAKSIALSPGDWIPLTEYGIFLYRKSRYEEAARTWERALSLAPDNVRILRNLGGIYHMLDRYDEAASILQRALEIEPSAQIYANLGTIRFFQGRYTDSASAFEEAVKRGGAGSYLYWGNLGDAYRWIPGQRGKSLENYTHAIELVREKMKTASTDPELQGSLAVYLAKSGQAQSALQEVARLEKLQQPPAGSLFKAALAAEVSGSRERALPLMERAMRAGYSVREIQNEPELVALRADARFRSLTYRLSGPRPQDR